MEGEYSGHVKEGKMHGVGVCVYTDGSRYQARESLPPPRRAAADAAAQHGTCERARVGRA